MKKLPLFFFACLFALCALNAQAATLQPGAYGNGLEGEQGLLNVVIFNGGEGAFYIEDDTNHFSWKINGDKLTMTLNDPTLPKKDRVNVGQILSDSSFKWDKKTWKKDPASFARYYKSAEGFDGGLSLISWNGPDSPYMEINLVNTGNAHTCDVAVTCAKKGNGYVCQGEDNGAITLTLNGDALLVDTTMRETEICAPGVYFTGKYQLAR